MCLCLLFYFLNLSGGFTGMYVTGSIITSRQHSLSWGGVHVSGDYKTSLVLGNHFDTCGLAII